MVKLDKHFFQILASYWLINFIALILIAIFARQVQSPFFVSIQESISMGGFSSSAQGAYLSGGENNLKRWLASTSTATNVNFFLINLKKNTLSDINVPKHIKQSILAESKSERDDVFLADNFIISPYIVNNNNHTYRIGVDRDELTKAYLLKYSFVKYRIIVALFISFCLCYFVTVFIYRRIREIRKIVEQIKKGHFSSVVQKTFHQGEIALLFNEVHEMSNTIEELINSKNRLLQDISHEFRSPLSRQLIAIMIAKKKGDSLESSYLNRIEDENQKLEQLVSELLEYSKSNREKDKINQPIVLRNLITDVTKNANFEFQTDCIIAKCNNDIIYQGDPGLLYRAIENIVRNSVKYAGVNNEISIQVYETVSHIIIEILDLGPGVADNELNLIFHSFHRVQNSNNSNKKGYGLGLAIAKEIIELHQGTIIARNRSGGGLTITIQLPIS